MKPPKRIRVGWMRFRVTHDPDRLAEHDALGLMVGEQESIVLNFASPHGVLAEHLLHEVLHACAHATKFDMSELPEGAKGEEKFVQIVSPVLLATLRENPKLVTFLLGPRDPH